MLQGRQLQMYEVAAPARTLLDIPCRTSITNKNLKLHTCSTCNKSLKSRQNLLAHKRIHTGEKPYKCKQCEDSFGYLKTLKKHLRVHTGDQPFVCTFENCAARFNNKSSQARHIHSHFGEKPYKCPQCDQCFVRFADLRSHQRLHCDERPYVCSVKDCRKRFWQDYELQYHTLKHHRDNPYQCSHCRCWFQLQSLRSYHQCSKDESSNRVGQFQENNKTLDLFVEKKEVLQVYESKDVENIYNSLLELQSMAESLVMNQNRSKVSPFPSQIITSRNNAMLSSEGFTSGVHVPRQYRSFSCDKELMNTEAVKLNLSQPVVIGINDHLIDRWINDLPIDGGGNSSPSSQLSNPAYYKEKEEIRLIFENKEVEDTYNSLLELESMAESLVMIQHRCTDYPSQANPSTDSEVLRSEGSTSSELFS